MADINPLDSIVTLFTTNYTAQDTITPTFAKIYTKPLDKEPRPGEDFVYVYSEISLQSSVGIGANSRAEVTESIKIDIRVKPSNTTQANKVNDSHARKVRAEILKIIYSNIVNPDSNFDYIDPNSIQITDLSNGMRGVFRYIIKLNLVDLCRDLGV